MALVSTFMISWRGLCEDLDAVIARDPAAASRLEVFLCYPSIHAVLIHRLAHGLWRRGFRLPARLLAGFSRFCTGIEIHPGAQIGRRLFIDHAMGVVIGETAEIGDDVTLYHNVTLGGVSPAINSRAQTGVKRHPTVQNRVIVGSGAQILGPIVVGECARVGANAVVVKDVPPRTTVIGVPARAIGSHSAGEEAFLAYGTPVKEETDPVTSSMAGLSEQIVALSARLKVLEQQVAQQQTLEAPVVPLNPPAKSKSRISKPDRIS